MTKINFRVDSSENFKAANTELTKGEPTISNSFPYELKISPSDGSTWDSAISINPVTEYTPSTMNEAYGAGLITFDNNFLYIKTSSGWKQIALADLGDITNPPEPPPSVTTTTTTADPNATTTTSTTTTVDPSATTTTTTVDPSATTTTTTTTTTSTTTTSTTTVAPLATRIVFDSQQDVSSIQGLNYTYDKSILLSSGVHVVKYRDPASWNSDYFAVYEYDEANSNWVFLDSILTYNKYGDIAGYNKDFLMHYTPPYEQSDGTLFNIPKRVTITEHDLINGSYSDTFFNTSVAGNILSDPKIAVNENNEFALVTENAVYCPAFNNLNVDISSETYEDELISNYYRKVAICQNYIAETHSHTSSSTYVFNVYDRSGNNVFQVNLYNRSMRSFVADLMFSKDESVVAWIERNGESNYALYISRFQQQDDSPYPRLKRIPIGQDIPRLVGLSDNGNEAILFNTVTDTFYGLDTTAQNLGAGGAFASTQGSFDLSIEYSQFPGINDFYEEFFYSEQDNKIIVSTSAGGGNILNLSKATSDNGLSPNFSPATTTTTTTTAPPDTQGVFDSTTLIFGLDPNGEATHDYAYTWSFVGEDPLDSNEYLYRFSARVVLYFNNPNTTPLNNLLVVRDNSNNVILSETFSIDADRAFTKEIIIPLYYGDGLQYSNGEGLFKINKYMDTLFIRNELRETMEDYIRSFPFVSNPDYSIEISSNNYLTLSINDFSNSWNTSLYLKEINNWGHLLQPPPVKYALTYTPNSDSVKRILSSVPSTIPSYWTDLSHALQGCFIFNQDISTWDVSNVTNFSYMFEDCYAFNQNINNWNVSNSKNFSGMFHNATSFNTTINSWDVSRCTDFSLMFFNSAFNQDIGSWDVGSALDMSSMFQNTSFNQDISSWNVNNCTLMRSMFQNNTVFNQPIGSWETYQCSNFANMFKGCTSFDQVLDNWVISFISSQGGSDFATNSGFTESNFKNTVIAWSQHSSNNPTTVQFDFSPVFISAVDNDYLTAFFDLQAKSINIVDGG